ncbi:MAG: DUF1570 domain-containing protein [Phycisphaerae bacterium]|nr:DUF1570 domain-containing protein [Phycisphaerae bacterium]
MNGSYKRWFAALMVIVAVMLAGAALVVGPSAGVVRADDEEGGATTKKQSKDESSKTGKKDGASKSGGKSKSSDRKTISVGNKMDMSPVPADEKLEKKLLKELGAGFKVKRTPHYSILYDTNEEDLAAFSHAIERTYRGCGKFCLSLGIEVLIPERKMIAYFFNEFADYGKMKESLGAGKPDPNNTGFYLPKNNYSYFYNFRNTPEFKRAREDAEKRLADLGKQFRDSKDAAARKSLQSQMNDARRIINRTDSFGGGVTEETLQHEVAHQVLWNIGFHNPKEFVANPRWFAEGIAQLFEPVSEGGAGNMGLVNRERLKNYQAVADADRLIPLKDFVSTAEPFMRGDAGGLAYPQSWALAHYLVRVKRKETKAYVELILKRPKGYKTSPEEELELFEKCFGKADKKWEKKWKSWMKSVRP